MMEVQETLSPNIKAYLQLLVRSTMQKESEDFTKD